MFYSRYGHVMTAKAKGNVLEDLVAMMHDVPGVLVEKRKKLPVLGGRTKRMREIDVLITSNVAGYEVRIALGCKNEAKALDVAAVDNFVGILTEVGIPVQHGILVSVNGYTRDAQDAANSRGIRTLAFEGLSANRLSQEINAALRSIVYLLVSQFTISLFPYIEGSFNDDPRFVTAVLDRDDEPQATEIMTCIWELWVSGAIPATIGEHLISLRPKNAEATWYVIGTVWVTGWMASTPGTFRQSVLKDTEAGKINRVHISAAFEESKGPLTLEPVMSEKALDDIHEKKQMALVVRVRVPRIVSDVGYWPPTAQTAEKAKALLDAGKPVTFADMEGTNIMDAWRFNQGSK
jgi:hypothetical protein